MEFKTYDNTILIQGKKYWWSGYCDCGLYTSESWHNTKCKIRKIEGNKIFIYDYQDNKEWEFTNEELCKNNVRFLKRNLLNLFVVIKSF
jgi:hypothetical protein